MSDFILPLVTSKAHKSPLYCRGKRKPKWIRFSQVDKASSKNKTKILII